MKPRSTSNWIGKRTLIFLVLQLVIWPTAIWASSNWGKRVNSRPTMPKLLETPRSVQPLFNNPLVISDQQLAVVLKKLVPRFQGIPKVNFVDHALRLWGTEVEFTGDAMRGSDLRSTLVNLDEFHAVWGKGERPIIYSSKQGLAVRTQAGHASVSHVDHLLASLAEVGTPLSYPIRLDQGKELHMINLVEHAIGNLSLNQQEYEWTVLALALFSRRPESWVTSEGQVVDFDILAARIMRQPQPLGVCYGQHRLYTLAMMLRIDDQIRQEYGVSGLAGDDSGLLGIQKRLEVEQYLLDTTARLYHTQSIDGYWDANWPDTSLPIQDPDTDALSRRILATGHTLEWWAVAPESMHPPRDTIIRAGQWLAKEIGEMDSQKVEKNYTFLTHAARALALWRGANAAEHYRLLR